MLRRAHFWLLAVALALAPLPLGLNRPLAWTAFGIIIGLLLLLWPFASASDADWKPKVHRSLLAPGLLLLAAFLWGIFQAYIPVSGDWSYPIWHMTATSLPDEAVVPVIAADPYAAFGTLFRWALYAGVFWLAYQHCQSARRAASLLNVIAIAGTLYSLYGLAIWLTGSQSILGMEKWAYAGDVTSTFVNKNHFATFAGISMLCCMALFMRRLRGEPLGWRLFANRRARPALPYLAAATICFLALLGSGSRGGLLATIVGSAVLVAGIFIVSRSPEKRPRLLLWCGAAFTLFIVAGCWYLIAGQIGMTDSQDRVRIYDTVLRLITERPLLGYGLGSFPVVFAQNRPVTVNQVWGEAHNTYLELLLELGIPAALAVFAAAALLIIRTGRGVLERRRARIFPVVALSTSALVIAHAFVDFSLQIPAISVIWLSLLGAGFAQSFSTRQKRKQPADERL
ncbi:O-antigen ligase family protein [Radicibacter daui]|uniref:O-antigen ligase family protein n=1 Tax=Radicibacter daui TaxID=3064829 RepID=UPI004046E342